MLEGPTMDQEYGRVDRAVDTQVKAYRLGGLPGAFVIDQKPNLMLQAVGGKMLAPESLIAFLAKAVFHLVVRRPGPFVESVLVSLSRDLRVDDVRMFVVVERLPAAPAFDSHEDVGHRFARLVDEA